MSAWHRPDVETAAVDILTGAVKPVAPASARQIVDGLLARGRDQRAAEVRTLAEQAAEADRLRADRDAFADRVDTLTSVARSNKRHVRALAEQVAELEAAEPDLCADCGHTEAAHKPVTDDPDEGGCDASGARVFACCCVYFIPGGGA